MFQRLFVRNVKAADQLEIFLVSAVSSLLLVRFFLHLAGYPQLGGGGLHIAHMLWGGLLMMAAIVLALSFLGSRIHKLAAIVGGAGFGLFIDELGKFITSDNNYFFEPTIAIIYALFVILFISFRYITNHTRLTSQEYVLNAIDQLEEAALLDMDSSEKHKVLSLLRKAGSDNQFAVALHDVVNDLPTIRSLPGRFQRLRRRIDDTYQRSLQHPTTKRLIITFFTVQITVFLAIIVYILLQTTHGIFHGSNALPASMIPAAIGELASTLVAAFFFIKGMFQLRGSNYDAYRSFENATLIQLFLTEFFMFYRAQFGALPGFIFNLLLYISLRAALQLERRRK